MVITVFGLGFVGLTTAVSFANKGIKVYGVDIDEERKKLIRSGVLPFHEPGLDKALKENIGNNFKVVDKEISQVIKESDCIFYCVGTPYGKGGQADLKFLYSALDTTLKYVDRSKYQVLVVKSTIPPSTTVEKIIPYIESKGFIIGSNIGVANNPEFLREGHCWDDVNNADRVVIGVSDENSKKVLLNLYESFSMPKFCVSLNTGEFIKYLSNTLLATLISYANEMSILADTIGNINITDAFRILLMDGRWNRGKMREYCYPGCGYGGYCLPKDTNAIYALSKEKGFDPQILKNVILTNENIPGIMAKRIEKNIKKESNIGILGLSFKPNSDDTRDTPAAKIIDSLIDDGFKKIRAYDPLAIDEFRKHYNYPIEYVDSLNKLLTASDEIVILTAWDEFKDIKNMTEKPIVDCRYML